MKNTRLSRVFHGNIMNIFTAIIKHIKNNTCHGRGHDYALTWEDDTVDYEKIESTIVCKRCGHIDPTSMIIDPTSMTSILKKVNEYREKKRNTI